MLDIAKFVTVRSAMDVGLSPSNVHTALRCIKFVYRVFMQTTKIVCLNMRKREFESERYALLSKILTISISLAKSMQVPLKLCQSCCWVRRITPLVFITFI